MSDVKKGGKHDGNMSHVIVARWDSSYPLKST